MAQNNQAEIVALQKHTEEFEWIKRNFTKYKHELEMINQQNPYECELYSVIACMLRCCMNDEGVSLRDVSKIQKCKRLNTENFRSKWGNPDFVVLDKKYNTHEKVNENDIQKYGIVGAVEIKYMYYSLVKDVGKGIFKLNFKDEIEEHIRYFKKVIYTNGLVWQFYLFDDSKPKGDIRDIEEDELIQKFTLGTVKSRSIRWEPNAEKIWEDLVEFLHGIDWKMYGKWGERI